ncbi:hypothetical protein AALP_AA7G133600 [Arabis alpina]|uniref:Uncharacterized protein n=1 Tax=Arabis alpina TaxID=50452 RepID=A0A087GHS9_ARAAL|nr:hypothetical protein AALP_AA7G133600 [Arabis alpina]
MTRLINDDPKALVASVGALMTQLGGNDLKTLVIRAGVSMTPLANDEDPMTMACHGGEDPKTSSSRKGEDPKNSSLRNEDLMSMARPESSRLVVPRTRQGSMTMKAEGFCQILQGEKSPKLEDEVTRLSGQQDEIYDAHDVFKDLLDDVKEVLGILDVAYDTSVAQVEQVNEVDGPAAETTPTESLARADVDVERVVLEERADDDVA